MLAKLVGNLFGCRANLADAPESFVARADELTELGDFVGAEREYRHAILLSPKMLKAHAGLGCLLLMQQRNAEAENCFRTILRIRPESRDGAAWLGQCAFARHDYAMAAEQLAKAHAIVPLDIVGRYLLISALINCGQIVAAQCVLDESLAITPGDPLLQWVSAIKNLLCGCWREGFLLYESRFAASRAYPDIFGGDRAGAVLGSWFDDPVVPIWNGQALSGKRLLLRAEQGLGDSIMMLRFLKDLRRQGVAKLALWAAPALRELAMVVDPELYFIQSGSDWRPSVDEFDIQCALMSLPHRLGVTPETLSGGHPFIEIPRSTRQLWAERVDSLPGLRVGIVWQGGQSMPLTSLRDVPCEYFFALGSIGKISLVSLQKEVAPPAQEIPFLTDWMVECDSMLDTAALIANLDLIISVDTAVAHLAGAVGTRVWLLNRFESEWRWGRGCEKTPWYSTMRIFNQTQPGDWAGLMTQVANELKILQQDS